MKRKSKKGTIEDHGGMLFRKKTVKAPKGWKAGTAIPKDKGKSVEITFFQYKKPKKRKKK